MMPRKEQSWPLPRPPWYPCMGANLVIAETTKQTRHGRTLAIAKTSPEVHAKGGFSDGRSSSLQAYQGGTLAITKTSPEIHGKGGLGDGRHPS